LEQQLERQTRIALNNPDFIQIDQQEQKVSLSEIFRWYAGDFGGSQKSTLAFINGYREKPIPENYSIGYYTYDWSLNGTMSGLAGPVKANNAARYIVSSTIPKGTTETKIFNNLYTQRTRNGMGEFSERATFFTSITSFLYGLNHRVNVGFDLTLSHGALWRRNGFTFGCSWGIDAAGRDHLRPQSPDRPYSKVDKLLYPKRLVVPYRRRPGGPKWGAALYRLGGSHLVDAGLQ
jgi:hypothetical protein